MQKPTIPSLFNPLRLSSAAAAVVLLGCMIGLGIATTSCDTASKARLAAAPPPAPIPAPATQPAAAAGQAVANYECRWTDEPITLDGRADEPAWQHAQVIDNFRVPGLSGPAGRAKAATRARMLWDREYLYFFADMEDADLYAPITEHQGELWKGDAFELFLKPADEKPGYYEFEVNPANATLELYFPARGAGGGYPQVKDQTHIQLKTAVQLRGTLNHPQDRDQGWSVEGRIRWRDLMQTSGRPNIGESWKFAFCRGDVSVGKESPELTSAAPLTQVNFHRYEEYSTVRFVGPPGLGEQAAAPAPAAGAHAGGAEKPTRPYGVAHYTPWTTSKVVGYPDPLPPYTVVRAFPNLKFVQPLYMREEPGTNNLLLLQHLGIWNGPGKLLRFKNEAGVSTVEELLFQDRLIMGMAFHPDFLHNGYIYLMSNGPASASFRYDRLARFTIDRKPPYKIDATSELVLLEWDSNGHNGGDVGFGPDGYLYHASGDGSGDSDANLRGQDLTHLNSAMIRIDVDHPDAASGKPYSIPKDNPFINTPAARPEVWAYGFRNPWRLAFDRDNGNLWVGQNGQDAWEQVYLVHRGENYGWSVYEGSHPFNLNRKRGPTPITPPTVEHSHGEMRSLTGGVVYHGSKYPELDGAFLYGDWSTGRIWGVKSDGHKVTWHKELAKTTLQITGFCETHDGDILVVDQGGGGLYRLEPRPKEEPVANFPRKLSETGLFVSTRDNQPDPALIPYDVNSPLWSDGASKERFIAIPAGKGVNVSTGRGWDFPEGTVLVKTFSLDTEPGNPASRKRVETRLMTRQLNQWAGYSYVWNDEQTDATLVGATGLDKDYEIHGAPGAATAPAAAHKQTWHFPSRTECMVCHTRASNFLLGTSTPQLNKDHTYPSGVTDNQLRTLEHLGILRVDYMTHVRDMISQEITARGLGDVETSALIYQATQVQDPREVKPGTLLPNAPEHMARIPNPYDKTRDLNARARSYLHANCAICHVEAGGGNGLMSVEFSTRANKALIFDVPPQHETFGIENPRLIAPGHPERSVLYWRLTHRGQGQMPPLASSVVDESAAELMREWIAQLKPGEAPPTPH